MSAPHRSSRRSTDHASTATERAANAARAMAVRAARRRDRMVEMGIALLDEFLPSGQRPQTRAEVGEFYTVADTVVAQRISQVPGVGEVTVSGADQPAVRAAANSGVIMLLGTSAKSSSTAAQ